MLKTKCLHPFLNQALAKCGHGDKILIADGNYPLDFQTHENSDKIYLNLTKGIPLVTDVLKVIDDVLPIESYTVMVPADGSIPAIFKEFEEILDPKVSHDKLGRFEFYEESKKDSLRIAIATGELRTYACVILTVGVV